MASARLHLARTCTGAVTNTARTVKSHGSVRCNRLSRSRQHPRRNRPGPTDRLLPLAGFSGHGIVRLLQAVPWAACALVPVLATLIADLDSLPASLRAAKKADIYRCLCGGSAPGVPARWAHHWFKVRVSNDRTGSDPASEPAPTSLSEAQGTPIGGVALSRRASASDADSTYGLQSPAFPWEDELRTPVPPT